MESGDESGDKRLAPSLKTLPIGRLLGAIMVSWLVQIGSANAQAAPPPPSGQILQDIERSLPNRAPANPEKPAIEAPPAPAARAGATARVTVKSYHITGNTAFED